MENGKIVANNKLRRIARKIGILLLPKPCVEPISSVLNPYTKLFTAEKAKVKMAIVTAVDAAVKGGKIKADQKETFVGIGEKSGIEALNAAFDAMGGRKSIAGVINPSTTAVSGKTWDEMIKEDPAAMEKLKGTNLDEFKAKFKAKFGTEYKD